MTWCSFFSATPIKYGAMVGGIGLAIGMSGSAVIALKISAQCSAAVDAFFAKLGENVTISELSAMVSIKGHSTPITLIDINAVLPAGVADDIMTHLNDVSDYCFEIPFIIGLCMTLAISLALASCVAVGVDMYERQKGKEDINPYSLIT